jgi:uncharacterized protein
MRPSRFLRSIVIVLGTLLALAPLLATAQVSPPPPQGITVVGAGKAFAPADTATMQIYLSDQSMMMGGMMVPEDGGMPGSAQPPAVATPGAAELQAAEPVVNAITETGVAEGDIEVLVPPYLGNQVYGPYGPSSSVIELTIASPDTEGLREVLDAAAIGAAESGQTLGGVNIQFTVNDCSQLTQDARQSAFDDARRKADAQASIMGATLGDAVAARDFPYGPDLSNGALSGAPEGGCTWYGQEPVVYGPIGPLPFDVTADPGVTVTATVEVTFEVSGEATPAS